MVEKKRKEFLSVDKKRYCLNAIQQSIMTIEEASAFLGTSLNVLLFYIKDEYNRTHSESLKRIILHYSKVSFYENKNISGKALVIQKEIVLAALTFRLSFDNLCRLFETSYDDIENMFDHFPLLNFQVYLLNLETLNESKELENRAFSKGKRYFLRAKELHTFKRKAILNGEKEKQEVLKEKILLLQTEINDSRALAIQNSDEITEEDLLVITDYRIKYGLSRIYCEDLFGIKESRLREFENKLMSQDDYYSSKLYFINEFHSKHSKLDQGIFKR